MSGAALPVGVAAGLGLLTAYQIARWRRANQNTLTSPSKYSDEYHLTETPEELEDYLALPAPHPTLPNKAECLLPQGRFVRGLDMNRVPPHWGLDVSAPLGTPVFAAKGGQVTSSSRVTGYGYTVQISHGDHSTLYAHLNIPVVGVGRQVSGGDIVGEVGRTTAGETGDIPEWGLEMGCHLHFEIHPTAYPILTSSARRLDPVAWLSREHILMYRERW